MAATRKSLATAIACVSAIAVLAGCSQDGDTKAKSKGLAGEGRVPAAATSGATGDPFKGLSADQIAEKAVAATKAASSLRMEGEIESDGEPVSVDLAMDDKENCTGRLGVEGGRADLRRRGEVLYMKGDETFWRASINRRATASPDGGNNDTVIELMKDRWIKMPARAVEDMRGVCDLDEMLAELDENKANRTGMTRGKDTEIDGVRAATLVKKKGRETTTVYVAKERKPYLLKVVKAGGDKPGTLELSDYDRPVVVKAPPADEVLDLEKLGGDAQSGAGVDTEPAGPGAASAASGPGAGPGADSGSGTAESGPGTESDGSTGADGDATTGADGTSADGNDIGAGSDTGSGADTGSGSDTGSGADTGSGSDTGSGAGAGADEEDGAGTS
ncbi:hypothetical protein J7E88_07780 [Streptomyces sp. ISL-10]|uniref:hypothetical protein n=1 Tax=Streptomyces sp. ISL-10 TaxID=2819172 RepID=UPI001BED2734|nr:hypothetical protein [Streptomyces sp. ISL-10]MBT2365222.1 hypothetical protein [Streptomyces sp. ISL-10]